MLGREQRTGRRYGAGVGIQASGALVVVSYRLGGQDGVSVEAAKWAWAFGQLGFDVATIAGSGDGGPAGAWAGYRR